jgi:hypothetical protein
VLGLIAPWPMAVLADSVLAPAARQPRPRPPGVPRAVADGIVGQIVGLAVIGLLIKLVAACSTSSRRSSATG